MGGGGVQGDRADVCLGLVLQDDCPSWNMQRRLPSWVQARCLMASSTLLPSLWQVSGDGCRGNSSALNLRPDASALFFRL